MVESQNVTVASETQPITKEDPRPDKGPESAKTTHCPKCGVLLWAKVGKFGDAMAFVRAGTLEENEKIVPDAHFFVRTKHPWITIPDGMRTFDAFPGPGDAPLFTGEANKRIGAAMAPA